MGKQCVLVQFETPKALANFSPAVGAAATTLGYEF
jgi:hypothetical protein